MSTKEQYKEVHCPHCKEWIDKDQMLDHMNRIHYGNNESKDIEDILESFRHIGVLEERGLLNE